MDIHPSGFPGLVGPEGGDFSHFDFSSHFRVLPSNGSADTPCPSHEALAVRSHLQSLHLQASPSNNVTPRLSQPLRIRDDNGKNHNSGSGKVGSPRTHVLSDPALPLLGSPPSKRLSHSISSPARLPLEEVKDDEGQPELLDDQVQGYNSFVGGYKWLWVCLASWK
ncbi:hypothetical protein GOP47_0012207 [Adiantum capillus-veneris]|uniref:Uncharacterized protein n=1 Tax=Adiantum capillus-veneris TaxID=13818 RepID=A0A9D4ZGN3_ADICA|nr:hypothetical protein GOP47_0012207 [Adiantum capillus-veneris]